MKKLIVARKEEQRGVSKYNNLLHPRAAGGGYFILFKEIESETIINY